MPIERQPFKKTEQPIPTATNEETYKVILETLSQLAIAISSLPEAKLLVGDPKAGPAAFLKADPETGLTVRYKPGQPQPSTETMQEIPNKKESPVKTEEPSTNRPGGIIEQKPKQGKSKHEKEKGKEQGQRIRLSGRLGIDPIFNTTKKGALIVRFPLAVPQPENNTAVTWRQCFSIGKFAEKIQQTGLIKGQKVEVTGYDNQSLGKASSGAKSRNDVFVIDVKPLDKKR